MREHALVELVLVALLLAALLPSVSAGFADGEERCLVHCSRAGSCGQGKTREYKRLKECWKWMDVNKRYGLGPGTCHGPNWIGDTSFHRKYFTMKVCGREKKCIETLIAKKVTNNIEFDLNHILHKRKSSNAFRDEIRFSRYPSYIRAVDKLTELKTRDELLAYIAEGGNVGSKSRFGNPIYRKVALYLRENKAMKKLLLPGRFATVRRARDSRRRRYLSDIKKLFDQIQGTKSRLKTKRRQDVVAVRDWLEEIKKHARWVRYIQDEAIQVQFYQREFKAVSKEVRAQQDKVYKLKRTLGGLKSKRRDLRASLARDKKNLVDSLHRLSRKVIDIQSKTCPS